MPFVGQKVKIQFISVAKMTLSVARASHFNISKENSLYRGLFMHCSSWYIENVVVQLSHFSTTQDQGQSEP